MLFTVGSSLRCDINVGVTDIIPLLVEPIVKHYQMCNSYSAPQPPIPKPKAAVYNVSCNAPVVGRYLIIQCATPSAMLVLCNVSAAGIPMPGLRFSLFLSS